MSFDAISRIVRNARLACVAIAIATVLSLFTLTPAVPLLQHVNSAVAHADTTLFATGLESSDPQPTWSDQADTAGAGVVNVGGFCCGLTAPPSLAAMSPARPSTA